MRNTIDTRAFRRRLLQAAVAVLFVFVTLLLIALCTNTIVLPFVNLSGAVTRPDDNMVETLEKPEENAPSSPLGFLEVLTHFGAEAPEGKVLSGEVYDNKSTLVLADMPDGVLPAGKTVGDKTALVSRMGFLVRANSDGTETLLSADGAVVLETIPDDMTITGHWDRNGAAVFLQGTKPVRYDAKKGEFVPCDYEPKLYPVSGIDLPVYYNRPDGKIELSYKDGKYGFYYTETGEPCYQYTHSGQSYQFIGGYGALGTADDGIIIVDYVARRYFHTWGRLLEPQAEGIGRLGYYRFDHGLMMILRETENGPQDLILTEDNRVFYLPADFTKIAYSDGVFLLEKDGRYGYLDYTGRWIAEPVYTAATPFSEGLAVVTDAAGKVGMIDTAGNRVVPCEFDAITPSSGGVIALCRNGTWIVLHKVK